MRAVFVDANEALANAAERIIRLAGLELRVNREPNITPPEIPAALESADIAIIDHSALPRTVARQCKGLRHVVFLGSGARSYMIRRAAGNRYFCSHDQGLWRYGRCRICDRPDVGSRQRHCAHGS